MNRLAVAAIAATLSLAVVAPAVAEERHEGQTVKKVVIHRDHDRDHRWRDGRRRHEGWREHHRRVVIIKHGHGKTVIKKREG
jgi:hypothetical protein